MKDKFSAYIEKLQPLLEKIKPWLKTKKAWVQIGLSLVAIICLIMAGVSSCSRHYVVDNTEATVAPTTATAETTEKVSETPEATATPEASTLPETATPKATESASSSDTSSSANDPVVPDKDVTGRSEQVSPTGVPLYTPVPVEKVDTKNEAYKTLIESCWGSPDYSSYYLYDMDADGIEELIMHYGHDDMAAYIDVYTFMEGELVFIGDATGGFASISGSSDGGVLVYYRREINGLKYESIEQLVKTGASMYVSTKVAQAQVDEYTVWETNVDIPRYRMDDFSPLN